MERQIYNELSVWKNMQDRKPLKFYVSPDAFKMFNSYFVISK